MDYKKHLYVAILCGGGGTRVWPLSVKKHPKQFLNFYNDFTLYQEAFKKAKKLTSVDKILVITNKRYVNTVKEQTPEVVSQNIIAEPQKKNTAMAMGVAAAYAQYLDPEAILVNLYSDHVIADQQLFVQTMQSAAETAFKQDRLVTVGIVPTYPHPGFGYIKLGEKTGKVADLQVYKVQRFVEKPDVKTAKRYLATKKYLWNAGIYVWQAKKLLSEFKKLAPETAQHIFNLQRVFNKPQYNRVLEESYNSVCDDPIDIAISEKTKELSVLPGKFQWNDVGSWEVIYSLGDKDKHNNVIVHSQQAEEKHPVIFEDCENNFVYSNKQVIGVLGVKNLVIVDTGEGLLIVDKNRSTEIKKIIAKLKNNSQDKYL